MFFLFECAMFLAFAVLSIVLLLYFSFYIPQYIFNLRRKIKKFEIIALWN